ncbi:hypothetical protein Tco_0826031 [Tanacetum coccineum]
MLLLLVQKKLPNLERDVIFDLGVALRMFTRHIVILKRVGRPSTGSRKLPEEAQYHQARDIQFCDGTLTSVRTVLYDIASNMRMDYLSKRTWSSLDKKRSHIMIKAIDQLLLERRFNEELGKVRWWERLRGRPQTASTNNMTLSYFVLLFQVIPMVAAAGSRQSKIHSALLILD